MLPMLCNFSVTLSIMSTRYDVELAFNLREDVPSEVVSAIQSRIDNLREGYETTFVSYLTSRFSRDLEAAQERLDILASAVLLETTADALALAKELVLAGALPAKAADDALHIAVATVHRIPFLLTWNCRHMANATMRPVIESVCAKNGFTAPIICTPEELMEPDL